MVTELQRRFSRSAVLRRGMLEYLAAEIGCINGNKRIWYGSIANIFQQLPEASIKAWLYRLSQCSDITPAEQAEIVLLLRLSSTALTGQQKQQIEQSLNE